MSVIKNRRDRLVRCAAALVAFILTVGMLYALYWRKDLVPFGSRSLMINDGDWQYLDFFSYLKDVLAGKNSLSYTFSKGIGSTGLPLFAYYLASPVNLLVVFFDKVDVHVFCALLYAVKLGLAAAFTAWFLMARFYPRSDRLRDGVVSVLMAMAYALGQYSIAQASNIMWLDGVYMLPLIMLGTYRVINGERLWKLALPVGLAILFNWYSAGVDCLFSIIYFFFELFMHLKETDRIRDWRYVLRAVVRYGVGMALGVLISSILFLPTVLSLSGTNKGSFDLHKLLDFTVNGNPIKTAMAFIPGSASSKGKAALCCGSMALIGAIGLFMLKSLPKWKRYAYVAIAIIGVAIYYWNPLVVLFSLLKSFDSYWYRYSYVSIALVVYLATAFFSESGTDDSGKACIVFKAMLWTILAGFVLSQWSKSLFDPFNRSLRWFIFACCALALMLKCRQSKRVLRTAVTLVCMVAFAMDLAYNVALLMDIYTETHMGFYRNYTVKNQAQLAAIFEQDDEPFRIVQTYTRRMYNQNTAMYDEPMGAGYWSNTIYASTVDEPQMVFLDKLGYPEWEDTLNVVNMCQIAADSLFSVKYVMSKYDINGLERTDLEQGVDGKRTYVNPYCLPFALRYPAEGEMAETANPFEYQNEIYSRLLGEKTEIYVPLTFTFTDYDKKEKAPATYIIKIPKGRYAIYGNIPWKKQYNGYLNLNGRGRCYYASVICPNVFYIPTNIGDRYCYVQINTESPEKIAKINEQFYALDLDAFERVTAALSAKGAEGIEIENGRAAFTVANAGEGERLYVSIPYNEGWTVTRNGERLTIDPEQDVFEQCLYAIPLLPGENEIRMTYRIPHLTMYILLSVLGVLLTVAIDAWPALMKKRRKTA